MRDPKFSIGQVIYAYIPRFERPYKGLVIKILAEKTAIEAEFKFCYEVERVGGKANMEREIDEEDCYSSLDEVIAAIRAYYEREEKPHVD